MENQPEIRVLVEAEPLTFFKKEGKSGGDLHYFKFTLGSKNGVSIVAAEEVNATGKGMTGINDLKTRDNHIEIVKNPSDEAEVDKAVAKLRAYLLSGVFQIDNEL